MTNLELEILRLLHQADGPVPWVDVLNHFLPSAATADVSAVLGALLRSGAVEKTSLSASPPFCSLVLSESGLFLLIQGDEQRKHEQRKQQQSRAEARRAAEHRAAERKADQHFQIKLCVLSAVLGGLLSNLDRLIPWLISLFH